MVLYDNTNRTLGAARRIPTDADVPNANNVKIPRPTRHRGVLTLNKPVCVYDTREASSESFADIIASSREATVVYKTSKIATWRLVKRVDSTGLADLEVTIYNKIRNKQENRGENGSNDSAITFIVSIPQKWNPKVFLAVLNQSIREHKVVSLERVSVGGVDSFSLNVVHCYFGCEMNGLHESLLDKGAYVGVLGGGMAS